MGFLSNLFGKRDAEPKQPPVGPLEETAREDVPCTCGCGRTWVMIRGRLTMHGQVSSFVAMPTAHADGPAIWFAVGDGAVPAKWACVRSGLQGENVAAGIVEPHQTPLGKVVSPVMSRAEVLADQGFKVRLFQVHDLLLAAHPDLRHVAVPEEGRDFSFQTPDCVYAQPAALRSPRNQQNFAECGERLFVRALLPVAISDGGELRTGVWVEVSADAFFALMKVWDEPSQYIAAKLEGVIENSLTLPGGNAKGAQVTMAPRTADQCLFVSGSTVGWLSQLMQQGVTVRDLPALTGEIAKSMKRAARA